jgi:putative two-component system response regulator
MKKTILIADDDEVFVDLMSRFFHEHDFAIITASDAMHASMIALRAPHPSLILLDIRMPAGSGLEVLKRLRMSAKTNQIPIIAVSADASPTLPEEARKLGATEFVLKPVDPEEMRKLAYKLLGLE